MPKARCTDEEFIALAKKHGPAEIARILGAAQRGLYQRRNAIENRYRIKISWPTENKPDLRPSEHPGRLTAEVSNGTVLVGSDCHYWPGPASLMHRAFVQFCKDMKPAVVVLNGDVLDFGSISRYLPIGWTHQPEPQEEIEAAQGRLHEIEKAAGKARKIWPLGNHDARFETRLATIAPEFAKVAGTRLADHFPLWEPCWSVWVNETVVIKHRFKGGIHATRNNTLNAGLTMLTGHLHSAKVTPLTDYQGTRFGVDTGCMADPHHRVFLDYREDSPSDWRDAFCVLTFKNRTLMFPELVTRFSDDEVQFRGQVIKV